MEKYIQLQKLGKGNQGNEVYLVKNLDTNSIFAMKTIVLEQDEEENLKNLNEVLSIIIYRLKYLKIFLIKT